jgi:hypothetical protein
MCRFKRRGSHRIERRSFRGAQNSVGEGCGSAAAALWTIGSMDFDYALRTE